MKNKHVDKLIEDLNNPINLKILKLNINTTIDYLPWEKEFYLYKLFKKKRSGAPS